MMQRILLAVDDSPASAEATHVTAQVARALKARVTVLHVYTREFPADDRSRPYEAAQTLVKRSADMISRSDAFTRYEVLSANSYEVANVILDAARALPAELIVLGSRGRRSLAELLLGSVSHDVVAGAGCPVLVVRSTKGLASQRVAKILLAIEGSAEADALFAATASLARALEAEVHVVHVSLPSQDELEKDMHHARESHGQQALNEISGRLREAGVKVTTLALVGQGPVARELAREAEAEDADLIVIGSGHLTGVVDRLAGSITEGVLHRTRRPVLVAKDPPSNG